MIVDICRLGLARSFVPGHSGGQRAGSFANVLDLTVAHEGIQDVLLGGVTRQLERELISLQQPVPGWLKADLE
jgi:hypothetical protein